MNKTTQLLFLVLICSTALFSCKKDRTCTCVTTYNIPGTAQYTDESSSTIKDAKKKDAKKACANVEQEIATSFGGHATGSCAID